MIRDSYLPSYLPSSQQSKLYDSKISNFNDTASDQLPQKFALRNKTQYQSSTQDDLTQMSSQDQMQRRIRNKLKFGRNYQQNYLSQQSQNKEHLPQFEQLTSPKRFSISQCLNQQRKYPTNIISKYPDAPKDHLLSHVSCVRLPDQQHNKVALHQLSQVVTQPDQATIREWPPFQSSQQPLVHLSVDDEIPRAVSRPAQSQARRHKTQFCVQVDGESSDDGIDKEMQYQQNQRVFTAGDPLRYQIGRKDLRAVNSYDLHLITPMERVKIKAFIPKFNQKHLQQSGVNNKQAQESQEREKLTSFRSKFISSDAISSQINGKRGHLFYDINHIDTSNQQHQPQKIEWQMKPNVPLPVFVSAQEFKKAKPKDASEQVTQKNIKVLVPVEQINCCEQDWRQERNPVSRNTARVSQTGHQRKVGVTLHRQVTEIEKQQRKHKAQSLKQQWQRQRIETIQKTIKEVNEHDEKEKDDKDKIDEFFRNY